MLSPFVLNFQQCLFGTYETEHKKVPVMVLFLISSSNNFLSILGILLLACTKGELLHIDTQSTLWKDNLTQPVMVSEGFLYPVQSKCETLLG